MWFGFGIITLVMAIVLGLKARLAASWRGVSFPHRSGNYEVQEIRHKGKLVRVRVGVPAPADFNFLVRVEGLRDRIFKWLGVTLEIQTKDEEFDRTLFVESDARGVGILLKRKPEVRRALIDLFAIAKREKMKRPHVRCINRRLWIDFRPHDKTRGAVEGLPAKLNELRTALTNHKLGLRDLHDRFVWRAAAVLALSTASIIVGVLGVTRATFGRTDILDSWSLFVACAIPGVIVAVAVLFGVVGWLGSSSRAHTVLLEFALVGTCGFALSAFALGREMNIEFDFKPAKTYLLEDVRVEHTVSRGRRGRTRHHYYVHTTQWQPAHPSAHSRLEISASDFQVLQNSKEVIVRVRPGALGFDWVEAVRPSWGELEAS